MPETTKPEQAAPTTGRLVHWRMMTQSWLHSRKALLLLVSFAAGTVALFAGKLNGDQWVGFVKWAVPAYMAANVGDAIAEAIGQHKA